MSRQHQELPLPVQRLLRKLGRDLREARLRRRLSTTLMAARASISRTTLGKIEKGDAGVSLGSYATVMFVLGLADNFGEVADARNDAVGLELAEEQLPQRIRQRHASKAALDQGRPRGKSES
ncbi:MAG: helix-turn-helix domain-containing protein [Proteobacteria bacterium]|nr:helix-turn-helix domain-containing protein [Pseudomonadota bacterium]